MISMNELMKKTIIKAPPRQPIKPQSDPEPPRPKPVGRGYVAKYQEEEIKEFKKESARAMVDPAETDRACGTSDIRSHCNLSEVDTVTVCTGNLTTTDDEVSNVYDKFDFKIIRAEAKRLEVYQSRDDILKMLEVHNVVIIKGATGCGKSTQVPQFILENAKEKNVPCNIVVTQPRRIAAVTVATRVAQERQCLLGTLVGYQIGLDKTAGEDTRILYVTTGVLLQKLIRQKNLNEFTHYIIDEIHERDQDMDFLLYMVRHFLNTKSKGARLILMSATIDTTKFHDYLYTYYGDNPFKPGIVEIKNRSPYKVMTFHLDDLCSGKNRIHEVPSLNTFDIKKPEIQPNLYRTAARIIQRLDVMEFQSHSKAKGAVLIFLPGLYEIQTMEKALAEMCSPEQLGKLWIKPLHSSITSEEQQQVFKNPPHPSQRKIILSTNIAESSVTVTDIEYVIDFCQTKVLVMDELTGCTSLELAWASRNNLVQRAGRVGRVREGRVYRMISKSFQEDQLDEDPIPEILRCPLETLVLKAKLLNMGSPEKILALTMDQPNLENIHQAVARLKEIGALLVRAEGKYDPSDGDLTWLGQVVASLPLDVRLSKLIFLGCMLGVPEECITMACAMASKNMFSTPYYEELEAYNKKLVWADSSCSDCIAFLTAYKAYRRYGEEAINKSSRGLSVQKWTRDNYLQYKALKEVSELADEVKRRLKSHNLYSPERYKPYSQEDEKSKDLLRPFFLKMAIAGAFYPNYFFRGQSPQFEEKQLYSVLNDHDPFCSVYLQGLPLGLDNKVYKSTIKKLFAKISDRVDVNTDNSTKAYITFRRELKEDEEIGKIPGKICMPVYKAIKMRQYGVKFSVPRLKSQDALEVLEQYEKEKEKAIKESKKLAEDGENVNEISADEKFQTILRKLMWPWTESDSTLPTELLEVMISHVESPERFWIQNPLQTSIRIHRDIMNELNNYEDDPRSVAIEDMSLDCIYIARYHDALHRCRILGGGLKKDTFEVHFIDWGYSSATVPANGIYEIPPHFKRKWFLDRLPAFAVECSLVKIRPKSTKLALENKWHDKAINVLKSLQNNATIAKVYSIVDDVLRVKLVLPQRKNETYNFKNTINFKLIESDLAEKTEEEYPSVMEHERMKLIACQKETLERDRKAKRSHFDFVRTNNCGQEESDSDDEKSKKTNVKTLTQKDTFSYNDLTLPLNPDNLSETILKGPFSPLEMKMNSVTRDTLGKTVDIERDSVNSVLLDTDPCDPKEKMLVAAYVGLNPGKDRLRLRHTTIMPKFPALPMLCCLTFAPMVEMRVNTAKTKYSGALCGLGYVRETGQSLYPVNDIAIVFDYEIDDMVLELINKIRYNLSEAINPAPKDRLSKDYLRKCGDNLKEYFKQLFIVNDYQLVQTEFSGERYRWNWTKNETLRRPVKRKENGPNHPAEDFSMVHRLIWAILKKGDKEEEMKNLLLNLDKLEKFAQGVSTYTFMECYLCKANLENVANARIHLKTKMHRMRLKRYEELVKAEKERQKKAKEEEQMTS